MGFTSDAISWYRLQAGERRPVVSSSKSKHILASYFGRVQYSLSDKYLFTFTGRVDGSDRFGENNRYAFFPSGAFAWRAINEDFLNDIDWLSDAKLRVSVGQVGNENIGNGAASEYYQFEGRNYYFGDSEKRGVNLGKFGNPNLKWETTTEVNFGVDYGFFRNRINGSIDIFYKEIKDLLSYRALPHTSIIGNIPWNIGKTRSSGVEVTLNTVNLQGPLYWGSTLTYTSYRDRWKERDPKVILRPYEKEDAPLSALYALIPDGIKQPGEDTPHMPGLLPGQQKYKDVNGLDEDGNLTGKPDGKIDQADVIYIGTHAPKFTMGFNNEFKYKGFDLNLFLYASVGAYRWPSTHVEHGVYGSYGTQMLRDNYNYLREIQNRWGSDNPDAAMPSGEVNSYDTFGASHFEKASYLRLKNLTLGYDITKLFNTNRLSARVFFTGQNLFTITGYNGFDPEVERDRASYPQQKTFSFGLDIKF
jgi:TonB-linked SusC/RagA family outer membrane protein